MIIVLPPYIRHAPVNSCGYQGDRVVYRAGHRNYLIQSNRGPRAAGVIVDIRLSVITNYKEVYI